MNIEDCQVTIEPIKVLKEVPLADNYLDQITCVAFKWKFWFIKVSYSS